MGGSELDVLRVRFSFHFLEASMWYLQLLKYPIPSSAFRRGAMVVHRPVDTCNVLRHSLLPDAVSVFVIFAERIHSLR